jgi:hypothetical protein
MRITSPSSSSSGFSDRLLILAFCGLTLLIVLLTAAVLMNRAVWRERTEEKLAELREAGYALSLEELVQRVQANLPHPNAADTYRQAFALQRARAGRENPWLPVIGMAQLPEEGEPMPVEMVQAIEEFLELNREAIELYLQAAAMEECLFEMRRGPAGYPQWEHLGGMREGARLLWLKAIHELEQGRPEESAATRGAMFRISGHLGADGFMIGLLTRVAVAGIAGGQLSALLSSNVSEEALGRLQKEVAGLDDEFLLAAALERELGFGYSGFEQVRREMTVDWKELETWMMVAYGLVGQVERDRWNYLHVMETRIAQARLPLSERVPLIDVLATAADEESLWRAFRDGRMLTDQSAIGFDRLLEIEVRSLGHLRVLGAAIAVARFRARHGHYPASLEDLAPEFIARELLILPGSSDDLLHYRLEEDRYHLTDGRHAEINVKRR